MVEAIPANERLANLSVRHWGAESGLPEETFASILAPGDGYVWLASNHGIVRFDGKQSEVFRLGDSYRINGTGSCSASTLSHLTLGPDRAIWAGSASGCIFRLVRDRFGSLANFRIEGIDTPTRDREPNGIISMWARPDRGQVEITRRSQIALLSRSSKEVTRPAPEPSRETQVISAPPGLQLVLSTRDANGKLWSVMSDRRLYSTDEAGRTWEFASNIDGSPRRIVASRDGSIWVGTASGLLRWRNRHMESWGVAQGLPQPEVSALREDAAGCLWMGFAQAVGRMCGGVIESIPVGVDEEEILSTLEEDPQGNLWAAGRWGNLYRISPRLFRIFTRREGLQESHLTGVAVDREGKIWGSLRSSGLVQIVDGRVGATITDPAVLQVQTLLPHPERGVIAAGTQGLFAVDERGVRPFPLQSPVPPMALPAMHYERPGQLLLSGIGANYRLHQPPAGGGWKVEPLAGPTRMRQWTAGRDGRIWGLAQYQGLHWLDGNRYRRAENAAADRARAWYSITSDPDDLLWIGTTDGLELYSTRKERFLTAVPLLAGDQVFHISLDGFGKIWCATRQGLVRFSRSEALGVVEDVAEGRARELLVERFGEAHALPTTNFGLVTSATGATDALGRIWFPGLLGLVSVNPADFERTPRPPAALLLQVISDGQPKDLNQELRVAPRSRTLEFVFQTLRLDPLGGEFCRLQLRGFDADWVPCRARRAAQYSSLPPGDYEFALQTSSESGKWNGEILRVPITIESAYSERGWVRLLAVLLLGAGFGTWAWRRHRVSQERTRLLEAKVEERTQKLEAAMQAAQAASRAKSEFLATMSHEIRTPMNGVLGAVQLLDSSPLDQEQQKLVSVIRQSGEDLVGIVDDILSLSKVEAGKLTLEKAEVVTRNLGESLVPLFRPKAEAKGVALRLLVDDAVPERILSDPQRLRQILLNLIGNAVKFTEHGEVVLRIESNREAGTLSFSVQDTGLGIASSNIPTLFDPFVQADSSTTRRYGGSGLGLSIVRRFVEAMNGSIAVESEPGRGSIFRVQIPLEIASAPPESADSEPPTAPALVSGLRVMIAEDNSVNQLLFRKMLIRLGCEVRVANDGRQALEILRTEPIDIVLMDCQMPELDGYETTREIRSWKGHFAQLPVIALTASAMEEDRQRCFAAGMNDFLSKPLILAHLEAALSRWSVTTATPDPQSYPR
jgi:signal transduction histidine kinase/ligand-binding sensor domain-containing protein/ActR/RegA family two-component response regulator